MGDVNSSQTMNNKKDQEIKDILKDVETTATNFNKINNNNDNNNINLNDNNKKENNNKEPNILQSIDDIRKIFNNDYQNYQLVNFTNFTDYMKCIDLSIIEKNKYSLILKLVYLY